MTSIAEVPQVHMKDYTSCNVKIGIHIKSNFVTVILLRFCFLERNKKKNIYKDVCKIKF